MHALVAGSTAATFGKPQAAIGAGTTRDCQPIPTHPVIAKTPSSLGAPTYPGRPLMPVPSPRQSSVPSFLVSDLCAVTWLFYAANQFWPWFHDAGKWGALAAALRLLHAAAVGGTGPATAAPGKKPGRAWARAVVLLSMVAIMAFGVVHSWRSAGALAFALAAGFGFVRVVGSFVARGVDSAQGEDLRFGALQGVALFAVHPYLWNGLLGAGDANSYSLLVADFIQQWRAGIFPVLIGQSEFAFNGGFHPLRNAPYLLHLAGLLDFFSLRTLSAFAVLNLSVFGSMLAGILGCYAALRIVLGRAPWAACGLAVLYGLCPGVVAPLYGGDMYPTFLTLPFIPWLLLGLERSTTMPDRPWPWILQGASLAAIAMAHPPVAAWAAVLAAVSAGWIVLGQRNGRAIGPMILGGMTFALLVAYLVVSLRTLALPAVDRERALATVPYILSMLRDAWPGNLRPVSAGGKQLLEDIQLGYGLWAVFLLSVAGLIRLKAARPLLLGWLIVLFLVYPVPYLAPLFWRQLPSLLLVTNLWPMERLYLLWAGVTVFLIAMAWRSAGARSATGRVVGGMVLTAACLWSAAEARKFFQRAADIRQTSVASADSHRRGNILLSRTHSYEYVGTPAYYSYGHMDPRLETRLLDEETRHPFADGTTLRAGAVERQPAATTVDLVRGADGSLGGAIPLGPGEARILRFGFLDPNAEGDLEIMGAHLFNSYRLPLSGLAKAFGSSPEASPTLIVDNDSAAPDTVSFRFSPVGTKDIRARIEVTPWSEQDRVLQLRSQTPFRAEVTAERDCYLETPKLHVPGYTAIVDGRLVPVVRSAEGLVAVPLRRGQHEVRVLYRGSWILHLAYAEAIATWLGLGLVILLYASGREGGWERGVAWIYRGACLGWSAYRRRLVAGLLATAGILLLLGAVLWRRDREERKSYGEIRMSLRLPWPEPGRSEPLVTTGKAGAGDFIYVVYLDGKRIQIGHDRWGYGGARSEPITVDYAATHTVEISLGSLYPPEPVAGSAGATPLLRELKNLLLVKWDGVPVLRNPTGSNPSLPDEVAIGKNTIGGSTTQAQFTGTLLKVERVMPSARE
jgi:hypothetical protein